MRDALAAHQANARAVLVGEDPPAVHLLLVDPAVAEKGVRTSVGIMGEYCGSTT
jgi:hypothetical protein